MKKSVATTVVTTMFFLWIFSGVALAEECQVSPAKKIAPGTFQMTLDLTGLPAGEVFWKGQAVPNGPWQFAEETGNISLVISGDVATVTISNWPEGESMGFSYGRGEWPDGTPGWVTPVSCGDTQVINGHFEIKLGIKPPVDFKMVGAVMAIEKTLLLNSCHPAGNTGDSMIMGVEDIGGDVYRLYLNFSELPGQPGFFGESMPNGAWSSLSVKKLGKCRVVEISWPYQAKIHFSWYGETAGEKIWADAENSGSKFATCVDGEGNKQFCLDPVEIIANN